MADAKRTLRYLRKAFKNNDQRILSQYTTEELIYLKKQLTLTDKLRELDIQDRRRNKGFSK
ncbi:hypothetical protein SCREM2_gp191 [Synechococcus phage S-CREM2]|nr:hypothetical protein SCREM2_gp191 [Synechococcus phage S-CREM2]